MTVPTPPLPEFRDLLAACAPRSFSAAPWTGDRSTHRAETYRLGRYALAAVVEALLRQSGASRIGLFVPDYICNEALERARSLPVDLRFYAIDENLAPEWAALEASMDTTGHPAALLLVHYFGFLNDTASASAFCRRHDLFLIEDAAHMLKPSHEFSDADAVVFSTHKLLPIGSCAVLVLKQELRGFLPAKRRSGLHIETLRWLLARVAQKFMIAAGISWHRRWSNDAGRLRPRPASEGTAADAYSQSLLNVTVKRADRIAQQRRRNYSQLIEALDGIAGIRPLSPHLADADCPYVLPLCVAELRAEKLSVALLRAGVPALRWPDLPPEVVDSTAGHEMAKSLFDQVILLPVHQSLRPDHIEAMTKRVREAVDRLRSA